MFSTILKTNFNFLVKFILSSANAFSLDSSKVLSFGKELNYIFKMLRKELAKDIFRFTYCTAGRNMNYLQRSFEVIAKRKKYGSGHMVRISIGILIVD